MTAPRSRHRWIAATAGALAIMAAAAAALTLRERPPVLPARAPGERPQLLLLTSLPIVFPEQFTLEDEGSPALSAIKSRYEVVPIGTTDRNALSGRPLLLMAQPHAQPAEMLVELDRWVRGGGRLLLLADPALEWPSELPLGDLARPPRAFPDTGLLAHWGLRFHVPDQPGVADANRDGRTIRTISAGQLIPAGGNCTAEAGGLVARCMIGKGKATIVADADFIDAGQVESATHRKNMDFLLAELARLEK